MTGCLVACFLLLLAYLFPLPCCCLLACLVAPACMFTRFCSLSLACLLAFFGLFTRFGLRACFLVCLLARLLVFARFCLLLLTLACFRLLLLLLFFCFCSTSLSYFLACLSAGRAKGNWLQTELCFLVAFDCSCCCFDVAVACSCLHFVLLASFCWQKQGFNWFQIKLCFLVRMLSMFTSYNLGYRPFPALDDPMIGSDVFRGSGVIMFRERKVRYAAL